MGEDAVKKEALETNRAVFNLALDRVVWLVKRGKVSLGEAAEMLTDIASVEDLARIGWKEISLRNEIDGFMPDPFGGPRPLPQTPYPARPDLRTRKTPPDDYSGPTHNCPPSPPLKT